MASCMFLLHSSSPLTSLQTLPGIEVCLVGCSLNPLEYFIIYQTKKKKTLSNLYSTSAAKRLLKATLALLDITESHCH